MNQDQVKGKLLQLDNEVEDFSVIFSGKRSRKVDGLYYPEKREIIIHNKNFEDDNSLIFTAIHEFSHHVHITRSAVPVSNRAHTIPFWDIFHRFLFKAESIGIYVNIFKRDKRFIELTNKIRENFLSVNGQLVKEFGRLLMEAYELCSRAHVSFEDYVDRELLLHRTTAKKFMKIHSMDINPEIGFENMKTVAGLKDPQVREKAEEAFLEGKSPDMVRAEFMTAARKEDTLELLMKEKKRIHRTLESLTNKLTGIEKRIREIAG